jgi:hypothetical protein
MQCSGYYEPVLLGAIFRRTMETGTPYNAAFADGEIKVYGRKCWKP